MPKKQNTKYTGFYWYMQAILPDLRRQGRSFSNGLADVVPVARPLWKGLTPQERTKYDDIAKEMKRRDKEEGASNVIRVGDDRLDNMGNRISDRRNRGADFNNKRIADMQWTRLRLPDSIEEVKDVKFYFIEFEHLLKLDDDYIPVEIAIIEWSMNLGISKELHAFIDPGGIPMGYRFAAQNHSDETHKIPIERFEQADNNYRGLWQRIVNFINPGTEMYEFPPVYCIKENVENNSVTSQLDWLFQFAGMHGNNPLSRVFVLQDLVKELCKMCETDVSEGSASDVLTTTMFDYEPNTKCAYHDELENVNCALGHVKRWAFAMADQFHEEHFFNFTLTKKHLPQRSDDASRVTVIEPASFGSTTCATNTNPQASGGAAWGNKYTSDTSRGSFASTDIRYRQADDRLVIKLDDSDDDSDELESQYSYASQQRKQELLDVDRYSAPSGTWGAAASNTKPNVDDEQEFPTLGGGGGKFGPRSAVPISAQAPRWNNEETSSVASSGWQPSAKYMEMKREEEEARNRQMSLDQVMARRDLEDDLSETYVKRREKDNSVRGGRGRGSAQMSYSQLSGKNQPRPGLNTNIASSASSQSATTGSSRPIGTHGWQGPSSSLSSGSNTGNSGAWPGPSRGAGGGGASAGRGTASGSARGAAATNPWAGGARRATEGAPRPQAQNYNMVGLGRGRGRGVWAQDSPTRNPGLQSDDTDSVSSRSTLVSSTASRQTSASIRTNEQDKENRAASRNSDMESNTSAMSGVSLENIDTSQPKPAITRPPPGFGRGILRHNLQ